MSEFIHDTSDEQFEADVLKASTPVLVDFWAEWCGPCKMIAPALNEVAKEFEGRLKVVKVNVDKNNNTPAEYGVSGIPNLILFKDGEVVASRVGVMSKTDLIKFISDNI